MYKNGQLPEVPDCKPWVEDGFWEIKRSNNAIVEEAYKQFNGNALYFFYISFLIFLSVLHFKFYRPCTLLRLYGHITVTSYVKP